jgi:glutamate racemase
MELPVAVFDSGLGGVSVLRELIKCMPSEDFYYYGDSLHAPYGTKSLSEVQRLTLAHTEDFLAMGIKGLVVACNTATSAAVALLREKYPQLPLVGIEPAVKPAVEMYPRGNILVMATPMTIREKKLHHLIETYGGQANVIPLSCPGLMDFVEVGNIDSPEVSGFLRDLLEPYRGQVDAVVLGCTHYPFVRHSIEKILGPDTRIFDGGEGTAKEMKRRLKAAKLYCENPQKKGKIIFDNSDKSHEKKSQFWKLLNY